MQTLIRGQKVKLATITPNQQLVIEIGIKIPNAAVDISCFGLDAHGQLSDDRYMIFYNQKSSPENALQLLSAPNIFPQQFSLDLARLPATIEKLSFVATIDGHLTMSQIQQGFFNVVINGSQRVATSVIVGQDYTTEKAIMVLDLYKKENIWRLANVGQGFAGGLSDILKYFGGTETQTPAANSSAPTPASPPAAASHSNKLSLTKITLEKRGDAQKIDLTKRNTAQPIHINLNWMPVGENQPAPRERGFGAFLGSLFHRGQADQIDLDLGCMYELQNGERGVIQPLGGYFGDKNQDPFIFLDKDDRSGKAQDGENLYLYRPELIKRVLIFAFIYEGTNLFRSVQSRVQILDQNQYDISIYLDNPDERNPFCAVCLIENHSNQIQITKEERYFMDHEKADLFYRFGFNWRSGRK